MRLSANLGDRGGTSNNPPEPGNPSAQAQLNRRFRLWIFILGVAVVSGAGLLLLLQKASKPVPIVSFPKDSSRLDPLLLNYVTGKVAWVRQAPRDAQRHATLGLIYAANGLWAEAKTSFENSILLNANEPLAHLYLAISYQELGQPDRAIELLRQLTGQFPSFAQGYFRLGDYALRVGDLDEAQRAFERLIQLDPKEWRGFAGLGEVRLRHGDTAQAVAALEKGLQLDPKAKSIHALLGQAYQRLGRVKEAERELQLGMNAMQYAMPDAWSVQAPQHMRLLVDLLEMAQEDIRNGAATSAVRTLQIALPFHSSNLNLLVTLAHANSLSGQPHKARFLAERALQLNPSFAQAYVALSGSQLAMGEPQLALSNADRAILLSSNRAEAYLAKANALLASERDVDAVNALREAHRSDPKNPQILLDLGDVLWQNLNQPEAARTEYRNALALNPSLIESYLRLAHLNLRSGDRKAAVEILQKARELAPDDREIAAALEHLNRPAEP